MSMYNVHCTHTNGVQAHLSDTDTFTGYTIHLWREKNVLKIKNCV